MDMRENRQRTRTGGGVAETEPVALEIEGGGAESAAQAHGSRGVDAAVAAQRKQRKRRIVNLVIWVLALTAVAAGGYFLYQYLTRDTDDASQTTYRVSAVSEGEINAVISGSGALAALRASNVTAGADAEVEAVYKQSGDAVTKGETVLTLTSDAVQTELTTLYESLADIQDEIADTTQLRTGTKLNVTSSVAGVVKDIRASAGDTVDDLDYLCLLSTDGKMKVEIPATEGLRAYDAVTVNVAGAEEEGYVYYVTDGMAGVVIDDNSYDMGEAAAVYGADGALLGEGTLTVNEHVEITASAGVVDTVNVSENQKVNRSRALFKLKKGAPTDEYMELKEEEEDLLEQIRDRKDALTVTAEWDGYVTSMPVSAGDEVTAGGELCSLAGGDGFTMSLAIDELDISSVKHGQDVSITLDAIDGTFNGTVANISYTGSGSYVTTYTVTIETDPIEGAYPGMSASAEVITETSGTSMIVQVAAVQYSGRGDEREAYVLLAGDGYTERQELTGEEIDLDALTKAVVTTGMSDGSYIVIESDALNSGDLILVPQVTTKETYTQSSETTVSFTGRGGMGGTMPNGYGGGTMPGGGNFGGGNYGGGNFSAPRG